MLPLNLYGSHTCEDTALVRDRLRALGIAYSDHNREDDARVDALLARWNKGNLVTPTLVFGDEELVVAEPSLEQLEQLLRKAGYTFSSPSAVEIRDERRNTRAPNFTLPATDGSMVTLYQLKGRKRAVLFFGHDHRERVCQGYARQLANQRAAFDEFNAAPLFILPDNLEAARAWAHEFARGYPALSDEDGRVRETFARYCNVAPANVMLVLLDSFSALRVFSSASEAGGLLAPGEVMSWLRLLDCECDECGVAETWAV